MGQYRNYQDEDIIRFSKEVKSLSGLLRKLNLRTAGGNFVHLKKNLQRLNVDCSHWTGKSWNKNERLKDWSQYTRASSLKKHLIVLRTHQCEKCKNKFWLDFPISLEIHHIDGDRTNNNVDNLQLLCCNCHSQTDFWRNKKRN